MGPVSPPAAAPEPQAGSGRGTARAGDAGFEVSGLELGVRIHTMRGDDAGGDFHDLVRQGGGNEAHGRWTIVVGEVRGRGADAAARASTAGDAIRREALRGAAPAAILRSLNELLLETSRRRGEELDPSFCTAVVASVEPTAGGARVTLAVGGHPPPLVLRRDGRVEEVGAHGTLLGVLPDPFVADQRLLLGRGDALVLYTDGITEAHARADRTQAAAPLRSGRAHRRAGALHRLHR